MKSTKPGKSVFKKLKHSFSFHFISNNCIKPNINLCFKIALKIAQEGPKKKIHKNN